MGWLLNDEPLEETIFDIFQRHWPLQFVQKQPKTNYFSLCFKELLVKMFANLAEFLLVFSCKFRGSRGSRIYERI